MKNYIADFDAERHMEKQLNSIILENKTFTLSDAPTFIWEADWTIYDYPKKGDIETGSILAHVRPLRYKESKFLALYNSDSIEITKWDKPRFDHEENKSNGFGIGFTDNHEVITKMFLRKLESFFNSVIPSDRSTGLRIFKSPVKGDWRLVDSIDPQVKDDVIHENIGEEGRIEMSGRFKFEGQDNVLAMSEPKLDTSIPVPYYS